MARPYESALDGSLRELIVKHARVKPALVRDEDRIAGDLGYDSFALVNLLLDLEDAYGFEVDASELAAFREMTYGQFRRLVGERLARTPSRGEEAVP